jgi:uncharacterized glyoxalase superfamily protein PhnB
MPTPTTIENAIPVLPVANLDAAIAFYEQRLGFKRTWGGGTLASVGRDGVAIMLRQVPGTIVPWEIWVGCSDAARIYKDCRDAGVRLVQPPTNQPWAVEMRIADPDGHVLWFGSEPLTAVPFGRQVDLG